MECAKRRNKIIAMYSQPITNAPQFFADSGSNKISSIVASDNYIGNLGSLNFNCFPTKQSQRIGGQEDFE